MICFKNFSSCMLAISLRINQQPSSLHISEHFPSVSDGEELAEVLKCFVVQLVQELVWNIRKNPVVSVKSDFHLAMMHRRESQYLIRNNYIQSIRTWNVVIHIFAYVQFWIQQDKKNLEPCVSSTWGQGRVFCSFSQSQIEEGKREVDLLKQTSFNYS